MAVRGIVDHLRSVGVLVRGIIVNFLIFLPYLLTAAIALGFGYYPGLKHPYCVTQYVLIGGAAWVLLFPTLTPLFRIVQFKRSVSTGSESTVTWRDRYERSFGAILLAVFLTAVLESFPHLLKSYRLLLDSESIGGGSVLAMASASLAVLSGSDKLLSAVSGLRRRIAMVGIGILGLLVPVAVILFVADFLVFSLPPEADVLLSPLWVPVGGLVGITIAILLGLLQRVFKPREALGIFRLLLTALLLLAGVAWGVGKTTELGQHGADKFDAMARPLIRATKGLPTLQEHTDFNDLAAEFARLYQAKTQDFEIFKTDVEAARRDFDAKIAKADAEAAAAPMPGTSGTPDAGADSEPGAANDENLDSGRQFANSDQLRMLRADHQRKYMSRVHELVKVSGELSRLKPDVLNRFRKDRAEQGRAALSTIIVERGIDKINDRQERQSRIKSFTRNAVKQHCIELLEELFRIQRIDVETFLMNDDGGLTQLREFLPPQEDFDDETKDDLMPAVDRINIIALLLDAEADSYIEYLDHNINTELATKIVSQFTGATSQEDKTSQEDLTRHIPDGVEVQRHLDNLALNLAISNLTVRQLIVLIKWYENKTRTPVVTTHPPEASQQTDTNSADEEEGNLDPSQAESASEDTATTEDPESIEADGDELPTPAPKMVIAVARRRLAEIAFEQMSIDEIKELAKGVNSSIERASAPIVMEDNRLEKVKAVEDIHKARWQLAAMALRDTEYLSLSVRSLESGTPTPAETAWLNETSTPPFAPEVMIASQMARLARETLIEIAFGRHARKEVDAPSRAAL
jgi:hypothetical protein